MAMSLLIVIVAACQSGGSAPALAEHVPVRKPPILHLLEVAGPDWEQMARRETAFQVDVKACMGSGEWEYALVDSFPLLPGVPLSAHLLEAQSYWGFGIVDAVSFGIAYNDANAARELSMTSEMANSYRKMLGVGSLEGSIVGTLRFDQAVAMDTSGCLGTALAGMVGDVSQARRIVERVARELETVRTRVAVRIDIDSYEQAWSSCMEAAGWSFSSGAQAYDTVVAVVEAKMKRGILNVSDDDWRNLVAFEREVAMASAQCELASDEWLAPVRDPIETQAIQDNQELFADYIGLLWAGIPRGGS